MCFNMLRGLSLSFHCYFGEHYLFGLLCCLLCFALLVFFLKKPEA